MGARLYFLPIVQPHQVVSDLDREPNRNDRMREACSAVFLNRDWGDSAMGQLGLIPGFKCNPVFFQQ
jgi:hypothetical protein